jgi:predicted ribosomally synthesized peptide with SipW-like signal peptide
MKKSAAKKTLIASAAAVSLSALLFAGTTFAWFTDSVSSGISTVTSGNLKIGFEVWNGENYVAVDENTNIFGDQTDLWEPGHVQTAYVRIANKGSLSLKYNLNMTASANNFVNVSTETTNLSNFISFGVQKSSSDPKDTYTSREDAVNALTATAVDWSETSEGAAGTVLLDSGILEAPGDAWTYLAITAYMPSTVGNDANYDPDSNTSAPQLACQLYLTASQTPDEEDSFDENYDKNASFDKSDMYVSLGYSAIDSGTIELNALTSGPIVLTNDASFNTAYTNGDCIIELNENTISATSTLNIKSNGKDQTVSLSNGNYETSGNNSKMVILAGAGKSSTVTIENVHFTSTISNDGKEYSKAAEAVQYVGNNESSGTVVFKDCVFDQNIVNFSGANGTLSNLNAVFENCTFNMIGTTPPVTVYGYLTGSISFNNCTFNLCADSNNIYAVKTIDHEYSNFAINFNNVTVNASLYDGQSATVDLLRGSNTIVLNGKTYSSIAEFNTAAKNNQIEGITYNLSQN